MRKGLAWAFVLLGTGYSFDTLRQIGAAVTGSQSSQPPVGSTTSSGAVQNSSTAANNVTVAKVDFQDTQPLSMRWQDGARYRASFFVRNDEPTDGIVAFAVVLQDNKQGVLRSNAKLVSGTGVIPRNGFDEITIEIDIGKSEVPLSGYIQMTASAGPDRKPAYQYKVLKVPPALPSKSATWLFNSSLTASLFVVLVSLLWLRRVGIRFSQRMGPPSWNFGDSWGTNITVGGALLTTLLGFSALPEQTHYLNKTAYLSLSLIFAALITVAPSIYALLRTPVNVAGATLPQYQGYVLSFALASGVTVWGALGQLETVGLLFDELADAREISLGILAALLGVLGLVSVLLIIYGCRTIVQIARQQQDVAAPGAGGGAPVAAAGSLPSWSVL